MTQGETPREESGEQSGEERGEGGEGKEIEKFIPLESSSGRGRGGGAHDDEGTNPARSKVTTKDRNVNEKV